MGKNVPWSAAWNVLHQTKHWKDFAVVNKTVGDSEVELVTSGTAPMSERAILFVFNDEAAGGSTVYVGKTGVTIANGWPIPPQDFFPFFVGDDVDLFAISDAAGKDVRIIEVA